MRISTPRYPALLLVESLTSGCGSVFLYDVSIDIPIWVYGLAVGEGVALIVCGAWCRLLRLNEIVVKLPDFWVEPMA